MEGNRDPGWLGRRAVLAGLAGVALTACAAETPQGSRPSVSSSPAPPSPSSSPSGPPPSPSVAPPPPAPSPAAPVLPNRDQIIAQFGARTPGYWGLEAPGVALRLPPGSQGIALTFDCCGGPGGEALDRPLIDALRTHQVPSTFFLNARWVHANPALAEELAADPLIEVANHGSQHLPLSMTGNTAYGLPGTRNSGEVYDEVMVNQELLLQLTGKPALWFRSGTAFLDDVSTEVVRALGLVPVNFSINGDAGATFPAQTVAQSVGSASAGDIVIAHANRPLGGTAAGVAAALPGMLVQGARFVRLSEAPPV
ncbi:polysaccharide deacetylase family protein [Arthrobacter sp. H5]|uniref:polysaccharide deacetylase family protein n=1 Tax=Arthrobacter sp. H5 TaxID=1267973 RepID=UPI0004851D17|nr:polysaccharide deacetylase family protein [Arthrobacter sp. H5]